MKLGASELAKVIVPPEDSAIPQTLDRLRDRLESWRRLTSTLSRGLGARASEPPPLESTDSTRRPSPSASAAEAEQPLAEKQHPATAVEPPAVSAPTGKTTRGIRAVESVEPDQQEPADSTHPAHDAEEEALLAALPAGVAKTIRVQHRLFDGRKSVRELIEKYRVEHGDEALLSEGAGGKTRKDSWWKRVSR